MQKALAKLGILVTRKPPESGLAILRPYCDFQFLTSQDRLLRKKQLIKHLPKKRAIFCMLTDTIDKEVLESARNIIVVGTMSVGCDHIDVEAATKRGVYIVNTPEVLTESTADHTWALLLAVSRRVVEGYQKLRKSEWRVSWSPDFMVGSDLHGKVLGIIGCGRIGSAVAGRAVGFGMRILYHNRKRLPPDLEKRHGLEYASLRKLLRYSDYVSLHTPLTKETHHMIGEAELRIMKPTAFLINTARGSIVNEKALVKALRNRWISGAALDVYEKEPIGPDHPLCHFENVVLTPHIASATRETRNKMAELAARGILEVLRGRRPRNLVNPEVLYVRPLSEARLI